LLFSNSRLFSLQAKARKAIVRQTKRSAAEAVVHPDELQDIHEEEKQETDRNMENMWRQLKQLGPGARVRLTHLVCNHSSFAQTVENIFTLSFLVSGAACWVAGMWVVAAFAAVNCWLLHAM
jgi:hypothetical protein